jgi:hypothetical protein
MIPYFENHCNIPVLPCGATGLGNKQLALKAKLDPEFRM